MHDLGGLQNPQSCHWSDDLGENHAPEAPGHQAVALDSGDSVETISMI